MLQTLALEGYQGRHHFFFCPMAWGELEGKLVFPDQLKEFDADPWRRVGKRRLSELVRYLLGAEHLFFSALTLLILPWDMARPAIEQDEAAPEEWDYRFERLPAASSHDHPTPGTLWLSGAVRLFTADGIHRARAAIEAMKQDPSLARAEVPVVLVPYLGLDQMRKLFSDLHLNAKPVSSSSGHRKPHGASSRQQRQP